MHYELKKKRKNLNTIFILLFSYALVLKFIGVLTIVFSIVVYLIGKNKRKKIVHGYLIEKKLLFFNFF